MEEEFILKRIKDMVTINSELCIGCGKCAADCIAFNIELKEKKAVVKKECFQCGHCVAVCPAGAVSITDYDMADVEEYDPQKFHLDPQQVLHSMKFRRSIRKYKEQKIEQEVLEQVLQAGRYAATAKNNQDCCFVFVQNELEQMKEMTWEFIDRIIKEQGRGMDKMLLPFAAFSRRRKTDPEDDFLFRNAPVVLLITSDWELDAGLAAQNVEHMAVALGLGALYNGYLAKITDTNEELKKWLGIEGKKIKACMLLGYPDVKYARTAPRRDAQVIWK